METEINVLALVKEGQTYVWLFDDASRLATLRHFRRIAEDPELNFDWQDAGILAHKLRDLAGLPPLVPVKSEP